MTQFQESIFKIVFKEDINISEPENHRILRKTSHREKHIGVISYTWNIYLKRADLIFWLKVSIWRKFWIMGAVMLKKLSNL